MGVVRLLLSVLGVGTTHCEWHRELAAGGEGRACPLMRMRAVTRAALRIGNKLLLLEMLELLLLLMLIVR